VGNGLFGRGRSRDLWRGFAMCRRIISEFQFSVLSLGSGDLWGCVMNGQGNGLSGEVSRI
jgi:hypothetical protein